MPPLFIRNFLQVIYSISKIERFSNKKKFYGGKKVRETCLTDELVLNTDLFPKGYPSLISYYDKLLSSSDLFT